MMNQEIKQQWVAALRSGEYVQGREALRTEATEGSPKHCCLGVLTQIYAREKGLVFDGVSDYLKDEEGNEYLGTEVMEWAQLSRESPHVEFVGITSALSDLNDEGRTFNQIADLIEEQL